MLLAGVRSVTDLMVNPGLINLDFADVQVLTFVLNTIPRLCADSCTRKQAHTHGKIQTIPPLTCRCSFAVALTSSPCSLD